MLVKDKNNLLSHDIWSCGDKSNSLREFYCSPKGKAVLCDEHAVNGDSCIKVNRIVPSEDTSTIYLTADINVTEYHGRTLLFKADVLNTSNATISLQLNDKHSVGYVAIPHNTSMETYSCSLQINENATAMTCLISINSNVTQEESIFTDNWRLIIS